MTEVTTERVRTLIDAYGADPERWPADEREAARRLVDADPALAAELAEAAAFDALLDALPAEAPRPALRVALNAIPDRARLRWSDRLATLWPFGAPWGPAAGLVAAALFGVVIGVTVPDPAAVTDAASSGTATTTVAYDPVAAVAAMASGAGDLEYLQ
ncbi:hypothetical protein GCM10017083_17060 [Thalassobaculum fulvum]|uniref:Uncharacterized protein n=1 Tax=Thalassobaculum fulvum TaxID=1633335 RepID=A0A918XQE7_9PROT|nr:hypothetical protein [Thalassobaculum fulvum]GHD47116.1 hypothetical protein GCM10017083_17060 [Thalassobaculum fulvum]